jgi:hypothetical protein
MLQTPQGEKQLASSVDYRQFFTKGACCPILCWLGHWIFWDPDLYFSALVMHYLWSFSCRIPISELDKHHELFSSESLLEFLSSTRLNPYVLSSTTEILDTKTKPPCRVKPTRILKIVCTDGPLRRTMNRRGSNSKYEW